MADEVRAQLARDGQVRVIVGLDEDVSPPGLLDAAASGRQRERIQAAQARVARALPVNAAEVARTYDRLPAMAMTVTEAGLEALASAEDVRAIHLDEQFEPAAEDEDEFSPALATTGPHIESDQLHDLEYRGAGQTVAVLDTGVDADHPAFGGRVVAEACFSSDGDCPNGKTEQIGEGAAAPLADDLEGYDHGTHVAGIAAGQAVDSGELSGSGDDLADGLAPEADIMAVQVFSETSTGLTSHLSDILAGLEWVAGQDAFDIAAVNLSLGGSTKYESECTGTGFDDVVADLASQDIAVVAASGNQGWTDGIIMPACVPGVISVGSTDLSGSESSISSFSNAGEILDLLAPGRSVHAALPEGKAGTMSGTSMAAPHVAGGLALLQEGAEETLAVDESLEALTSTGVLVADDRDDDEDPPEYPEVRLAAAHDELSAAEVEPGAVTGTVRDEDSSDPVADAIVELADAESGDPVHTATTDGTGSYGLDEVESGTYELTVSAADYETATEPVTVDAGATTVVDVDLAPTGGDTDSDTDSGADSDAEPAPGTPQTLAADEGPDEVVLSWEPGDGGAVDEYVLDRDGGQIWSGAALSATDDHVDAGETYVYELRAVGPGGTSEPATVEVTVPEPIVTFTDVDPDGPHGEAIGRMAGAGIINGYDDDTFRPARTVTRAQAAALLVRGLDITVDEPTGYFDDVSTDHVHAAAIEAAARADIVAGYGDGTFRPSEPLTRAQTASVVARAFALPDGGDHGFSDVVAGHPHEETIAAAAEAGAVGGYADGTFRPDQHLTRAQAASILDRLLHD